MDQAFYLTYNVRQALLNHCTKEFPLEACGILSGSGSAKVARTFWPVVNQDRSENSFSMSLTDIRYVFEKVERMNEEVLAIYHSHPKDKAYPSPGDIAMNNYPELTHIIVSLSTHNPEMRSYHILGEKVVELTINLL